MQVSEVMSRDVQTVESSMMLDEAAELMRELDVGAVPVVEGGRLLGILTDRDIVVRAIAVGDDPASTTVREAMTPELIVIYEDQSLEEASALMSTHKIRRLLVLDRDKSLAGIVSLGDLSKQAADQEMVSEVLKSVSEEEPRSASAY